MMLKRWFLALFAFLLFVAPGMAQDPVLLRVLTYNTHHGEGLDGKLDLPRIASVIGAVTPSLVALQEIDVNTSRSGKVDQCVKYVELTGLKGFYAPAIEYDGGLYGIMSLCRLRIQKEQYHALPFSPGHERRMVIEQLAAIPQGSDQSATIRFFATHLDHTGDHTDRVAAAKVINEIALKDPEMPSLLAGDLKRFPAARPWWNSARSGRRRGRIKNTFRFPRTSPISKSITFSTVPRTGGAW